MNKEEIWDFEGKLEKTADYLTLFSDIGYIGDSLSSGEFVYDKDGKRGHWDSYIYSWGSYIERFSGIKCTHFCSGGLRAKDVYESSIDYSSVLIKQTRNCLFEPTNAKKAYFIALGLNDINHEFVMNKDTYTNGLGDASNDINLDNYEMNADSFAGWYAKVIQRIQSFTPDSKFFIVGLPDDYKFPHIPDANKVLKDICNILPNCYYLDLYNDAPAYNEDFYDIFFEINHMNAMGYIFTAKLIQTLADRVIKNNYKDFQLTQFIGTPLKRLENNPQ